MNVLSIDPGGRNTGWVLLNAPISGEIRVLKSGLIRLAYKKDSDEDKIKGAIRAIASLFLQFRDAKQVVDMTIIENQNFGKSRTTIDNIIYQSCIASHVVIHGSDIAFVDSRSKMGNFEAHGFVYDADNKQKSKKMKNYSLQLAAFLNEKVRCPQDILCCDHRADAFTQAMSWLYVKDFLTAVFPTPERVLSPKKRRKKSSPSQIVRRVLV